MHDVVIVGAGIAGLCAAWDLRQRGFEPLILEQATRAGGVIVTEQIDGFVIDGGPDSLFVQKPAAIDLCRELGIAERLVSSLPPRTAFVMRAGRLVPLPAASVLGLPTRIAPLVSNPLFSWRGKLRMAMEPFVSARRDEADESIASFMRRRFGDEVVEYLAEPLLAGIHAGDVDRLSMPALFPRLTEAERTHGSVLRAISRDRSRHASNGAFVSFPGGLAELVDALVAALPESSVRFGAHVEQVRAPYPYRLTLSSTETLEARAVIVATPAWSAATLLEAVDVELTRLCGDIQYASSVTVAFAFERDRVRHALNGTGFVVPRHERRAVMAATWVSSKWPHRATDGYVLLRAFLGGTSDPDAIHRTDAELATRALEDLTSSLGIDGKPSLTRVFRWPRATPQYNVGHLERVQRIDARLVRLPGLYLTGGGYRGTGIPDCIADARATAANAAAFLQRG